MGSFGHAQPPVFDLWRCWRLGRAFDQFQAYVLFRCGGVSSEASECPRPRRTRHVWIRNESKLLPPIEGFALEWRRHSYPWSALVQYVREDDTSPLKYVQEWLPAERL